MDQEPWPSEIRLTKDRRSLEVSFAEGVYALPAEYLRVMSPSAEVQGHSPAERKTVPGKSEVGIRAVEPVGNYAVRLVFDDGHDTGIFGWTYLAQLGRRQRENWQDYLERLAAAGMTREPTRRPPPRP